MKISNAFSIAAAVMALCFSASGWAVSGTICSDGARFVELGSDGKLTAHGFFVSLQKVRAEMDCRPEMMFEGPGIWKNWFEATAFKCSSKENSVRLWITRNANVRFAHVANSFGVLIFSGFCHSKR